MSSREIPDRLVGSAEAAAILGVEPGRVSRYRKQGRMPPSAICDGRGRSVHPKMSGVWYASVLEAMRERGPMPEIPPVPLVGVHEIAEMLHVNKSQVGRWRREDARRIANGGSARFPAEAYEIVAGKLWWRDDIRRFARARRVRAAA